MDFWPNTLRYAEDSSSHSMLNSIPSSPSSRRNTLHRTCSQLDLAIQLYTIEILLAESPHIHGQPRSIALFSRRPSSPFLAPKDSLTLTDLYPSSLDLYPSSLDLESHPRSHCLLSCRHVKFSSPSLSRPHDTHASLHLRTIYVLLDLPRLLAYHDRHGAGKERSA